MTLNSLSREQLTAMLHTRDEELVSLRAVNKQAALRIVELERALTSFGDRIKAAEQLDADIRAAHLALSRQQNEAARRAAIATEEKELLLRQIDSLGRQLELEAVRRSGCFASLGLKLGQSADSDPVVVLETRSPAKESGVEVGDQLTAVRLTSSHSIQCLADYGVVAADLTPDACAELSLIRRGRQVSVLLRPALVSN